MWVMAIDAVVFSSRASRQIPIPVHAPMGSVFVITHLRAVTLCAKCHHLGKFNSAAIGKFQCVVVFGVVTRQATDSPMCESSCETQRAMKLVQVCRDLVLEVWLASCVAGRASDSKRLAVYIVNSSENPRWPVRFPNADGIQFASRPVLGCWLTRCLRVMLLNGYRVFLPKKTAHKKTADRNAKQYDHYHDSSVDRGSPGAMSTQLVRFTEKSHDADRFRLSTRLCLKREGEAPAENESAI